MSSSARKGTEAVLSPMDVAAIAQRAAKAIHEKRLADAAALLEPALRRAPGNARLLTLLRVAEARMLAKRGRITEAIGKYEEVLQVCPTHRAADRDLTILRCLIAEEGHTDDG